MLTTEGEQAVHRLIGRVSVFIHVMCCVVLETKKNDIQQLNYNVNYRYLCVIIQVLVLQY